MAGDWLACVEVGGSGVQTVLFAPDGSLAVVDGAVRPSGARLGLAVPGLIDGVRVAFASNLDWIDVDPAAELGLDGAPDVVVNDAEAAALGEASLRAGSDARLPDVVFIGLGTGVGGAVVRHGDLVAENLFGHMAGFSDRVCPCGRTGCLETVAAGWALPTPLDDEAIGLAGEAIARAVADEPVAATGTVIVAGGLARRYPALVVCVADSLPDRSVEPSAAPPYLKSAAAWGLQHRLRSLNPCGGAA